MEFRILGPLEVTAGGRLLELGRPKQRAVLAILLVHANHTVSLEHLVDELWGDEPPAQAIPRCRRTCHICGACWNRDAARGRRRRCW